MESIFLDGVPATVIGDASPTSITIKMDDLSNKTHFFPGAVYIVANTGAVVTG